MVERFHALRSSSSREFFFIVRDKTRRYIPETYELQMFEPLHILHLRMSDIMKLLVTCYMSSDLY